MVNHGNDTVSVINSTDNSIMKTIIVGDKPRDLAINSNSNLVYIANAGHHTVSVINSTTNSLIEVIPGFDFPISINLDPNK